MVNVSQGNATQAGWDAFNNAGCSGCHGMDAKGNKWVGAPNLTDEIWLYGGSTKQIETTLRYGRAGRMPAQAEILGEEKVHVLSAYVYSLSQDK